MVNRFAEPRSCPRLVPAVFRFTDAGRLLDDLKIEHIKVWTDQKLSLEIASDDTPAMLRSNREKYFVWIDGMLDYILDLQ